VVVLKDFFYQFFFTSIIGNNAKKFRQRLALDNTPEVKVSLKVPKGFFQILQELKQRIKCQAEALKEKQLEIYLLKLLK
jgi:hypothetical protein